MEDYLEYIDAYFNRMLSPEETKRFEQRIEEDKDFAEEVGFYLSAKQTLKEHANQEKKEWFRQLQAQQESLATIRQPAKVKQLWLYRISAAAAVIVCIFFAWYLFFSNSSTPQQMADNYIDKNLQTLSVKMSTELDSLQNGLRLYNNSQYDSALNIFEDLARRDTENYVPKEYAGIVYLRLGNYDKALQYFKQFENYSLYSNQSLFYQALTLMKRNQPGDKQKAKELLQQVVTNHLEGKETAEQWLDKW
jgi:tetratricopeptide (TPR) repeat protein